MTTIAHLTASVNFGGPERQMLGLARSLRRDFRTIFFAFSESGRAQPFLTQARSQGFSAQSLDYDTPNLPGMVTELVHRVTKFGVSVLCCHGYKANLVGVLAARRTHVPVIAVARGWTAENLKVKSYEALDRFTLRRAWRVVCVCGCQSRQLAALGIRAPQTVVIHNAVQTERFSTRQSVYRKQLQSLLPKRTLLVGAAGRLVREKGFHDLVRVADVMTRLDSRIGFILFGEGPEKAELQADIHRSRLTEHFALAGFRADLDSILPCLDVFVHPSYREGLPNVVLEACAAGVPVIASTAGGTREILRHDWNGLLFSPGQCHELRKHLSYLAHSTATRRILSARAKEHVETHFSFARQSEQYTNLFRELMQYSCTY